MDLKFIITVLCLCQIIEVFSTYHLLSRNGIPFKDPYHTIKTPFQQKCISICALTSTKCRSFAFKEDNIGGGLKCLFFDVTSGAQDLVQSTGYHYYIDTQSCLDWYHVGARASGVYEVNLMGRLKNSRVKCNMELEGGGWMVFQLKKMPTSINFEGGWDEYKAGKFLLKTLFYNNQPNQ